MKPIIVSGNIQTGKPSSVADILAKCLSVQVQIDMYNGSLPEAIAGHDLVIWTPDISNEHPKIYPRKDRGAVLICSKVMRRNLTEVDAVTRIFAMHANAVICIYKADPKRFRFKLIDALGNTWSDSHNVEILAADIVSFYQWSKGQVRVSFVSRYHLPEGIQLSTDLIHLNTLLADKVEAGIGSRYFGNFSTRCMKLFPSARVKDGYLFSPRNIDKQRLTKNDFVLVAPPYYYGDRKYSVDSPCQVQLYQQFDNINFMIHGHALIKNLGIMAVAKTENYYPCGDLREVEEIARVFRVGARVVNLRNHGFLLATNDLVAMDKLVKALTFVQPALLKGS